jgi:hypothetical protein
LKEISTDGTISGDTGSNEGSRSGSVQNERENINIKKFPIEEH